ncbi:DUF4878 domain-containing protein [Hippea sp. KM1]|uniref:DUF4878 domain-containing protein n=1 Tax=Hippea sp. KM1 TaxID=944481 RepID=UPI00046D376B|nr:DUF4878 domain-containing protein [Hippea sp. KM1]
MKKLFKFLVFLLVLGAIAVAAAFFFTSSLPQTADDFFKAIKNNDYNKAAEYLSENFKSATPVYRLKAALPYERFKHYSGYSFNVREVNADGTGKLKGVLEFDDGSKLPITIRLIKENDQWKINYIKLPPSGLTVNQQSNNQPKAPKASYDALVHKTMVGLVYAIMNDDYEGFYRSTSRQFQRSVALEKIKSVFSQFKGVNINWNDIPNMKPVIKSSKIKSNGVLKIVGYYPTQPRHLGFDFEYLKNNGEYKVFGVFLRLEK